jgi:predicted phage terminase large subunit-like protein
MASLTLPKQIDPNAFLMALEKEACERSLAEFVRRAWSILEPGAKYVHGWHIDFLCQHLEAITAGERIGGKLYNRLLANVPPGMMKSMLVSVFWPAWEWGPKNMPWLRIIAASHNIDLAERDNIRMRRLITSDWYRALWGDRVILTGDQNQRKKFETTAGGWRHACAAGSITGTRGDRVIIDDPHSVDGANSDATRNSVGVWFREAVPTRLNNPRKSAIVVIMQRLHEADVSGIILDGDFGYDHVMLPMRFDPDRAHPTKLGLMDPRTERGELLFPERFPEHTVARDERVLGPYAVAGQFQQTPTPRGGGIIQDAWWGLWTPDEYPPMDFIVASIDTAYTEKQENDPSALTIWGVWSGGLEGSATRMVDRYGRAKDTPESARSGMLDAIPKVMLMYAWADRLGLHDLVNRVAKDCRTFKVDRLLVENKATGISVAQEIRRLYGHEDWAVHLIDPKSQDKLARLYSVQPIFAEGQVFAPDKTWSEEVIRQCASVPKCKHDDLCDATSQALKHLRECGLLTRSAERLAEIDRDTVYNNVRQPTPLYSV